MKSSITDSLVRFIAKYWLVAGTYSSVISQLP